MLSRNRVRRRRRRWVPAATLRVEEAANSMLDRLISGAGALTDAADRLVRLFDRNGGGGVLGHRPGSVVVAGTCAVLSAILIFAGIESTDNPAALTMTPVQVAHATDLGSRTYATISGSLASTYVETYTDDNGNG